MEIKDLLERVGVVPVVKAYSVDKALELAKLLLKKNINVIEVTYRTDSAGQIIKEISEKYPNMNIGAGTVLTLDSAKSAIDNGATFIVAPGFNPEIVKYCLKNNILCIPGVSNPSQIEQAASLGLSILKFFPAELSGGVNMLKAFSSVYPDVSFMPTGGVKENNVNDYLALNNVVACGGTWIVPTNSIESGDFDKIEELLDACIKRVMDLSIAHSGLYIGNKEVTDEFGREFSNIFQIESKPGNSSMFIASDLEFVYEPMKDQSFHIGLHTASIARALNYLEPYGVKALEDTKKYANGKLKAVYLEIPNLNYLVHLVE